MFTQVVIAAMPPEVENALSLTEFAMAKHGTHLLAIRNVRRDDLSHAARVAS